MNDSPGSSEDEPKFGFDFPDDYAQCIAKITSYWSALESNINMSVWHLAGVYPAVGACLTEQIFTLDGRMKALAALLKLRQAPKHLIQQVNKFSEKSRKAHDIRNRIAHHTWHQGNESKRISQLEIGARHTLTYGFVPVPIEKLRADQDTVRNAMKESAAIRDAIETSLPTLPEIPLVELHPIVLRGPGHEQTRYSDQTFLLFPPKPSSE
jgi:hypothetical protein